MMTIHNMATWMIDRYGDAALRAKYVPRLTAGELIASYCLTAVSYTHLTLPTKA